MSRASIWYIIRRTYAESKFGPYSASSATRWCLTIKITLKSAFLGSITSSKGLEVNVLSILIFLKIFISQGPILKIEVLMTLIEISRQFYIILLKKINVSWSIIADLTRLTSDIFEIGQFFMSIRNYYSTQTNHRKNLKSPLVRKSNLRIINIFGREILNSGSGRKTLSKTHRPKTGVAAPWELIFDFDAWNFYSR